MCFSCFGFLVSFVFFSCFLAVSLLVYFVFCGFGCVSFGYDNLHDVVCQGEAVGSGQRDLLACTRYISNKAVVFFFRFCCGLLLRDTVYPPTAIYFIFCLLLLVLFNRGIRPLLVRLCRLSVSRKYMEQTSIFSPLQVPLV